MKSHFHHHSSNSKITTSLSECIGYKLIDLRSNNEQQTISKKEFNLQKKRLLEAMNEANREFRINGVVHNNKENLLSDVTNHDNQQNNIYNINGITNEKQYLEINEENIETLNENINKEKISKNCRRVTCCACKITSTKSPSSTFTRLPPTPINKITKTSSDNVIETYYRKKFIRAEWLLRLNLPRNFKKQNLLICDKHKLEIQSTEYKWINNKNKQQLTIRDLILPQKQNDPPLITRIQHEKRKPISIKDNSNNKSSKKQKLCTSTSTVAGV